MTPQMRHQRPRRAHKATLGLATAATMIGSVLVAPAAMATDFTVTTYAQLVEAIQESNANAGLDTITIDGVIVLEGDLPFIEDDLIIQGANGATIDGDAQSFTSITATGTGLFSIEGVDFRAIKDSAIRVVDVAEMVIFSSVIEDVTGSGVSVYAGDAQVEVNGITVRHAQHDGVIVRLEGYSTADIRNIDVVDSGLVDAAQPDRRHGGVVLHASHSSAIMSNITYRELTDDRDDNYNIDFAAMVVYAENDSNVSLTDAAIYGPVDIALQLTSITGSTVDTEALTIDGESEHTLLAVDVLAEDAGVTLTDFGIVDSGAIDAALGQDATFSLMTGSMLNSGIESAWYVRSLADSVSGTFEASDIVVDNAPVFGVVLDSLAEASLNAVSVVNGGSYNIAGAPAMYLRDNGNVTVTNSTISNNHGLGVVTANRATESVVTVSSTTIADNGDDAFMVTRESQDVAAPSVTVHNSIISGTTTLEPTGEIEAIAIDFSGVSSTYSLWNGASDDLIVALNLEQDGNIANVDPQLEPLADNGGPTLTRMPSADSPVIDSGDPNPAGTPELDQRGAQRIVDVIDMGSVETVSDPGEEEPGEGEPGEGEPGTGTGDGEPGDDEPVAPQPSSPVAQPGASPDLAKTGVANASGLMAIGGLSILTALALMLRGRRRPTS